MYYNKFQKWGEKVTNENGNQQEGQAGCVLKSLSCVIILLKFPREGFWLLVLLTEETGLCCKDSN